MKKTNSRAELHQEANSNDGDLDLLQSGAKAELHFYRLCKPWHKKGEVRNVKIEIGNSIANIAFVNDDEGNYYKTEGFISKWEQSLEFGDKTNEIKVFDNKIKRKLIVQGDLEFLHEGTWIVSVNEELETTSNFKDIFVVIGNQKEYGWYHKEPNLEPFENFNAVREGEIFEILAVHIRELVNLNGYALNISWNYPAELDEENFDYTLKRIIIRGKYQRSLWHSIELQGLNKLFGKIYDTRLNVNKSPMLLNPISLQSISKFWSMWMSSQVLSWGKVRGFTNGANLRDLLTMPNVGSGTLVYSGTGKIISAQFEFVPLSWGINFTAHRTRLSSTNGNMNIDWMSVDRLNYSRNGNKTFTLYPYETNLTNNVNIGQQWRTIPAGQNNNVSSFIWNGFVKDERTGLTNDGSMDTAFAYWFRGISGTVIYENASGTRFTVNQAKITRCSIVQQASNGGDPSGPYNSQKKVANLNFSNNANGIGWICGQTWPNSGARYVSTSFKPTASETDQFPLAPGSVGNVEHLLYDIINPSIEAMQAVHNKFQGFARSLDTSASPALREFQCYVSLLETPHTIRIERDASTNRERLIKLLGRMLIYTYHYKKGFPYARYNGETGAPMNMAAILKDKFNNTNHTPQQVITNLVEQYKQDWPEDLETEQWANFMAILPMMGNYILSDYCINGGLNDQHTVILPWFFEMESGFTTVGSWYDTDNLPSSGQSNLYWGIENTGRTVNEVIQGQLEQSSAWIVDDFRVILRSNFFTWNSNGTELKYNFDRMDQQPAIRQNVINRTFPTFIENMEEGDVSTVPQDINLSDDNLRYMFNVIWPPFHNTAEDDSGVELTEYDWTMYFVSQLIGRGIKENFTKNDLIHMLPGEMQEAYLDEIALEVDDLGEGCLPTTLDLKGLFGNELEFEFVFEGTQREEEDNSGDIETEDGTRVYVAQDEVLVDTTSFKFTSPIFNEEDDQVCRTQIIV